MNHHAKQVLSDLTDEEIYSYCQMLNELPIRYGRLHAKKSTYGTDDLLSVSEVHILSQIADNPNITATELAEHWGYTKGAISHVIKSLSEMGLLIRQRDSVDSLKIFLTVSDKGKAISDFHKSYDVERMRKQLSELKKTCSDAEILTYFRIMGRHYNLLRHQHDDCSV